MLAPTLALAVAVLGYLPAPDPTNLVGQLGSPRYATRESAEVELARLGRAAMPALKAARDSKDPEVRTRASAILSRIESSLLLEATPVALDFRDVPLVDAIEAINRRSGLGLVLSADESTILGNRRLALRSDEPLPFWKAIDAFCAAAGLHHAEVGPAAPGAFTLLDGYPTATGPVSDSGPFRVSLSSIRMESEIRLDQPGQDREGARDRQFFLQLLVAAEPRLAITQDGPARLTTAVDDRGQSLLDAPGSGTSQRSAGYFGMNPTPSLRLRADLRYPASPGRQIRLIRGTIPVVVATRKPDPLVVPLAQSAGKTFRTAEVDLTLLDHRPARGNAPATIQVAIRPLTPGRPRAGYRDRRAVGIPGRVAGAADRGPRRPGAAVALVAVDRPLQ